MIVTIHEVARNFRCRIDEHSLSSVAKSVREHNLTYLSPAKMRRLEHAASSIIKDQIRGDVIEFGVALGGSAIVLASQIRPPRRFIGLDVFEMIPPPNPLKDDAETLKRYEIISSGKSSGIGDDEYYGYRENLYEDVCNWFKTYQLTVDGDRIQLHQGLFQNTWPQLDISSVALAHIDCDWHDAVAFCLGAISDLVSPGGIILIDDYHHYGGCRMVVDEFINQRSDYSFELGPNPILRRH
jgi:O-methyltransferase